MLHQLCAFCLGPSEIYIFVASFLRAESAFLAYIWLKKTCTGRNLPIFCKCSPQRNKRINVIFLHHKIFSSKPWKNIFVCEIIQVPDMSSTFPLVKTLPILLVSIASPLRRSFRRPCWSKSCRPSCGGWRWRLYNSCRAGIRRRAAEIGVQRTFFENKKMMWYVHTHICTVIFVRLYLQMLNK